MWNQYLTDFLNKLDNPPEELSKLINEESHWIIYKGFGTPELEMKFLHSIFLKIQKMHPEFESISWEQCNAYNDNYFHFQLMFFTVNEKLDVNSDIDFYFKYEESDEINSNVFFTKVAYPDPEEILFAKENNLPFDDLGIDHNHYSAYIDYISEKYKSLLTPTLKFLVLLKLLEKHFSMYYFLYTFGNGVEIVFNKEGVKIRKMEENEMEGYPLGRRHGNR